MTFRVDYRLQTDRKTAPPTTALQVSSEGECFLFLLFLIVFSFLWGRIHKNNRYPSISSTVNWLLVLLCPVLCPHHHLWATLPHPLRKWNCLEELLLLRLHHVQLSQLPVHVPPLLPHLPLHLDHLNLREGGDKRQLAATTSRRYVFWSVCFNTGDRTQSKD